MMEQNPWKSARAEFDAVPLPEELNDRVLAGIREGQFRRKRRRLGRMLGTCAACFVLLLGVLNLSPTVAKAAADLPGVGGVFQVLTFRNFRDADTDRTVSVAQPGITGTEFAGKVNAEIQQRVRDALAEGDSVIADYKESYFATGGTQEEWEAHNIRVTVDYAIKYQTDTRVSFVLDTNISLFNSYHKQYFYNLDLAEDRELTLRDLLGDDWTAICNRSIRAQMAAAEDPTVYFTSEQGGFTTVDESTPFYINSAGNPVVVFPRATVAIGALGVVEFEITETA